MRNDERRITLVGRHKQIPQRSWQSSKEAASRIVLLDSFTLLRSTVLSPLVQSDADVERVILDRCCSESEYLTLLAEVPQEFGGDILMIRQDDSGFLSATGRRGDRVLYALSAEDVEFYLETHRLVVLTEAMQNGVLQFRPRIVATASVAAASQQNRSRQASKTSSEDDTLRLDGRRR